MRSGYERLSGTVEVNVGVSSDYKGFPLDFFKRRTASISDTKEFAFVNLPSNISRSSEGEIKQFIGFIYHGILCVEICVE